MTNVVKSLNLYANFLVRDIALMQDCAANYCKTGNSLQEQRKLSQQNISSVYCFKILYMHSSKISPFLTIEDFNTASRV